MLWKLLCPVAEALKDPFADALGGVPPGIFGVVDKDGFNALDTRFLRGKGHMLGRKRASKGPKQDFSARISPRRRSEHAGRSWKASDGYRSLLSSYSKG